MNWGHAAALAIGLAAVATGADWPQLQRDAAKSGYQPAMRIATTNRHANSTPYGGYGTGIWAFTNRFLSGQPVVAGDLVVVGSLTNRVFALDLTNGSIRWSADVGSAVLNSCAIHSGRVIVATQSGLLIALNPANGQTLWTYHGARKGYAAAPTVADGVVYIGSKDGRFHAVDALTGATQWIFQVGGPADTGAVRAAILCSAAVLSNRVFFGAENMYAYALDRGTGQRLWRRKLTGQSFVFGAEVGSDDERGGVSVSAGWPVASRQNGGVVIFRTQPVYPFHRNLEIGEWIIETATGTNGMGNPLGNTNAWRIEQRAISAWLSSNAQIRSFWELDPATGADKYSVPMPILYTSGSGGTPAPPVVDDVNNRAWVVLRSAYSRIDSFGMVRQYGEFAKLHLNFDPAIYTNPAQGRLAFTYFACHGWPECITAWGDIHKVSDEGEVLTACENALVSSTWVNEGGWDLDAERSFNIRYYSSNDLGEAPLYGSSCGAVFANGWIILRDTVGVKGYEAN
ncbi:MAG: PQQ-binding-like beta-propeller repeat protein [Kiritimatiellae bacterium]|nr:PQQ-binding-like beta-propeller repeat protein [Kiritimatiellia bacterium]MDW8459313.1 PQQ-binding-like beta-propeller repeat protein [Verrucomicrobiota bacterium]